MLKLKNADQETKIDFPCLHEHIRYRLEEIGLDGANAPKVLVREVEAPRALSFLEGLEVNVDEINYLANEIESLEEIQAEKLYAIIAYKGYKEPKDLINAKFNLDCYTLIQDVRNLEKIGRIHLSTLRGGLTQEELETTDFAKIGRELLDSGKGIYTEYGILFRNEEIEYKEAYDGQVFPEGWYGWEKHVLEVEIEYNGKSEYVYLPEEELAIKKSLKRLGAPYESVCTYQLKGDCFAEREWAEKFKKFLDTESSGERQQAESNAVQARGRDVDDDEPDGGDAGHRQDSLGTTARGMRERGRKTERRVLVRGCAGLAEGIIHGAARHKVQVPAAERQAQHRRVCEVYRHAGRRGKNRRYL